ncbi:MAG: 23S rRNA (uracil(1939)-C(5))-methyltransferase RlmD [Proteobacteria bacterium]|nr:23S rRNA (uracil(1939)-C(5))-methyltransferase RlmD [Pseudomonadota bacterium]
MSGAPARLPHRPRRGDELETTILGLNAEGFGEALVVAEVGPDRVARQYELRIRRALPGERVRVRIEGQRRAGLVADVVALLEAAPQRIAPRCPHFGAPAAPTPPCGGCSLQSWPYEAQLAFKHRRVQALLAPAGVAPEQVAPVLGQAEPWYYRNKMEYSFQPGAAGGLRLGLHPPGQAGVVLPLSRCDLLSPGASALLPRLAAWAEAQGLPAYEPQRDLGFLRSLTIREGKHTGDRMLVLLTSDDAEVPSATGLRPAAALAADFAAAARDLAAQLDAELTSVYWTRQVALSGQPTHFVEQLLYGDPVLHEELHLPGCAPLRFEIHPRAFFQPNTLQAERLYAEVLRAAAVDGSARLGRALDLYCGTGTIALCLAQRCEQVVGVELVAEAVANAQRNATFNALDHVRFHAGDALKVATQVLGAGPPLDLLVVDPPRSGLGVPAVEAVHRLGAPRVVYVSCNPEALANDLRALAYYGYRVERVQPVDLFPQTAHVESVATLVRSPLASAG